jgi:hypothetical protein
MPITKKDLVRMELERGRAVSGLSALRDFRLYRLSGAIHKLREEGLNIETQMVGDGEERFAEYRLANG